MYRTIQYKLIQAKVEVGHRVWDPKYMIQINKRAKTK